MAQVRPRPRRAAPGFPNFARRVGGLRVPARKPTKLRSTVNQPSARCAAPSPDSLPPRVPDQRRPHLAWPAGDVAGLLRCAFSPAILEKGPSPKPEDSLKLDPEQEQLGHVRRMHFFFSWLPPSLSAKFPVF